jgi:predicted nuclease of predicted toxin-antitoxin system
MKLLLDENLPKRLKAALIPHDVYTVRDMGWNGIKNGELLKLMLQKNFDALLTFDKNLQHQQNFLKYSLPVIVLNAHDNTFNTLETLIPQLFNILNTPLRPGGTTITLGI